LAVIALALAVHPSVPAQNLNEFVAYAKTHAGKLSYAHVGVGSTPQLIGEMFKLLAGLPELVQVPYRGAGPAIADLISGQVAMAVVAVTGQSAYGLQPRAAPLAAQLDEPSHLRCCTAVRCAALHRRLRSADRRHHRPTGHCRPSDSNRRWIKVGGNVRQPARSAPRAFGSSLRKACAKNVA